MDKDKAAEEFMDKLKLLLKEAVANGLDEDKICTLVDSVLAADNW